MSTGIIVFASNLTRAVGNNIVDIGKASRIDWASEPAAPVWERA